MLFMLDGPLPVDGFLPIIPLKKDAILPPQKPSEAFFREVADNLRKVPYYHLCSGVPPRIKEIPLENAKPSLEFLMLQEAKEIYDESNRPVDLFQASERNGEQTRSGVPPIQVGDYLHGMPIKFFENAGFGILAPEFYGGETKTVERIYCSLYASQVINTPSNDTLGEIIKGSHTGGFGVQEGTVTVVFDKDAKLKNLHRAGIIGIVKPNSVARAISVGESLTSVKCCVVTNPQDIPEVKKILSTLKMFIPLYDSVGNKLFTQEDWLKAQTNK